MYTNKNKKNMLRMTTLGCGRKNEQDKCATGLRPSHFRLNYFSSSEGLATWVSICWVLYVCTADLLPKRCAPLCGVSCTNPYRAARVCTRDL